MYKTCTIIVTNVYRINSPQIVFFELQNIQQHPILDGNLDTSKITGRANGQVIYS